MFKYDIFETQATHNEFKWLNVKALKFDQFFKQNNFTSMKLKIISVFSIKVFYLGLIYRQRSYGYFMLNFLKTFSECTNTEQL